MRVAVLYGAEEVNGGDLYDFARLYVTAYPATPTYGITHKKCPIEKFINQDLSYYS